MASTVALRDRLIPWYFVIAFVLLFVVEAALVTIAVSTQRGVVVDNAYERGLAYNHYIAEADAQAKRGWKGRLIYGGGAIAFTLRDKAGQPLSGADVKVTCRRSYAGQDFTVTLAEGSAGGYMKSVEFPARGQWVLEVSAKWQNQPFVMQQTIFVE